MRWSLLLFLSLQIQAQDLTKELAKAEQVWKLDSRTSGIHWKAFGSCKEGSLVGLTDFVTREITLNSDCKWNPKYLHVIVVHEVGHLLMGQGHSSNRHSVMFAAPVKAQFWQVLDKPHIMREDRKLAESLSKERF